MKIKLFFVMKRTLTKTASSTGLVLMEGMLFSTLIPQGYLLDFSPFLKVFMIHCLGSHDSHTVLSSSSQYGKETNLP